MKILQNVSRWQDREKTSQYWTTKDDSDPFGTGELELKNAQGIFKDRCHVLINGSGVVNKWKCELPFGPLWPRQAEHDC